MVNDKRLMKYQVSFPAYVSVIMNDDLTVISHEIDYVQIADTLCVDLSTDTDVDMVDGDYPDIVGNATVYSLGLRLVSGTQTQENNEPF